MFYWAIFSIEILSARASFGADSLFADTFTDLADGWNSPSHTSPARPPCRTTGPSRCRYTRAKPLTTKTLVIVLGCVGWLLGVVGVGEEKVVGWLSGRSSGVGRTNHTAESRLAKVGRLAKAG